MCLVYACGHDTCRHAVHVHADPHPHSGTVLGVGVSADDVDARTRAAHAVTACCTRCEGGAVCNSAENAITRMSVSKRSVVMAA